jgi:NADPH:quinone reductase-like Zn-dependent oxidoreductase
MKAVWLEQHGGPEVMVVSERPEPERGPDDVLVEVRACGLNHLDIWVRMGGARKFPLPLVPGSDATGVVLEAPAASRLSEGDAVLVYPASGCLQCPACARGDEQLCGEYRIFGAGRDGGYAERAVFPARNCVPKPTSLTFTESAAVAINYVTAWHMLTARAGLSAGERVLIQAAGSGVSTAAIQIAKFLGARVVATSSTDEKLEHAANCGADLTLNYKDDPIAERVRDWTNGHGVDVVLDHVGQPNWETNLAALSKGGRFVFCGTTGGAEAVVPLQKVYGLGQSLLGSTMGTLAEFRTLLELMEHDHFRPVIDRIFPLDEIADAHRHLESGKQIGKVVIEP